MNYKRAVDNIRTELKRYLVKGNLQSLVMGISGGIDSTLCVLLAKPVCDKLNIPLIGRSLPTSTNAKGENSRAKNIGEAFCSQFEEVDIQPGFHAFSSMIASSSGKYAVGMEDTKENILDGNIKARIRMILLYDLAGSTDGLVLSTDNLSEYLLGFWTLHGDVGDYGMIQNLWKTEVYEMAEWIVENELTVLEEKMMVGDVIDADATDGLGISKTDLDQILPDWEGSSRDGYAQVDLILQQIQEGRINFENPVAARHVRTHFKRMNPYNISRNEIIK